MWTALFIVVIAAATCFGVAALFLQFRDKNRDVTETSPSIGVSATGIPPGALASGLRTSILLIDRMKALHIDPDAVARAEPGAFQELSMRCATCNRAVRCASGLARNSDDEINKEWPSYCPSASTLSSLASCGLLFGVSK